MDTLQSFFAPFRRQIVGIDHTFMSPYGRQALIYADWTASGRLYAPIEHALLTLFGPLVGNTHSESSITGSTMTQAYHHAQHLIKQHVNAAETDVLITAGAGMTTVVNKLQRLLGLRVPEQFADVIRLAPDERPVVFVTHMEHHSNHTSWVETLAEVVIVPPDAHGLVDPQHLADLLPRYANRPLKIGAFTACSNVTGIMPPYYELARLMHSVGGWCFVDFSASAPYVQIDMHPADPAAKLDAIYFSPHKFLGGPGSPGVLVFDQQLYHNRVPDQPGGGTVTWTNPWHEHRFVNDIELREDGGTPGFLQTIKAALAIQLKEAMGVERIRAREHQLVQTAFRELRAIPNLRVMANHVEERLPILSFYIDKVHYNLVVRLLNDRFGIQVRGGCSCAGTYGHYLLHIDWQHSHSITSRIDEGDLSVKPGWVRLSLHPTTTDAELDYILDAIRSVARSADAWAADYSYCAERNEFVHRADNALPIGDWFDLAAPAAVV